MLLWLAHRAWNLFWNPQGDCLGRRGTFLSCDFGLPRTGSSSAVYSGSLDSLHSSSDTSSSATWALGLKRNGLKPLEPSDPTYIYIYIFTYELLVVHYIYIYIFTYELLVVHYSCGAKKYGFSSTNVSTFWYLVVLKIAI